MVTTYGPTERVDWKAAVWAGVIAGIIFLVLEMVLLPLFLRTSGWAAVRMIAAIVLGPGVLAPPATFDIGIFLAAAFVHFILSIIYALILAWIVHRWSLGPALLAGALFGLALYVVNFHLFTAAFRWFGMARNWVSVLTHIVFGVSAAWAYKRLERTAAVPRAERRGGEPAEGRYTGGEPTEGRPAEGGPTQGGGPAI